MSTRNVFLSYHTPDALSARRLAEVVRAVDSEIEFFFAPRNLIAGTFWTPALGDALARADAFLLLLGRSGPGDWQTLEYFEALDRRVNDPAFALVPVLMPGASPRLPFLRQLQWIEAQSPDAPEAAAAIVAGLRGDPPPEMTAPWRTVNPYRGLHALGPADSDFFFGRESLTAEVLEGLLASERIQMLVGSSGVGKSSVVRAGVVASLVAQRWPSTMDGDVSTPWPESLRDSRSWLFLDFRPGEDPVYELARAFVAQWTDPITPRRVELADEWAQSLRKGRQLDSLLRATADQLGEQTGGEPPRRFVLVLDQVEELYTRADGERRGRLSELLADAQSLPNLHIIGSIRSDHYGQLQADEALFPASIRIDVPPLDRVGLTKVIERPAQVLGASFEDPAMIEQVVSSCAGEPGALPLLSYFMEDLWQTMQRRGDGTLRRSDQPVLDGVKGVLARRANEFYAAHPDQQDAIRNLFTLRLTHLSSDDGTPVRRRARRADCTATEWRLAQELAGPEWRLIVTGENDEPSTSAPGDDAESGSDRMATVEVGHEVLLREWPRLHEWLQEERSFKVWQGQIENARRMWEGAGSRYRDEAWLTGLDLSRALQWRKLRGDVISSIDREFIDGSRRADEKVRSARMRRRTWIAAGFAGLAMIAILVAWVAWELYGEANRQTREAEFARDRALRAQSLYLADLSGQQTNADKPLTGMRLALEALPRDLSSPERPFVPRAMSALYRSVDKIRLELRLPGHRVFPANRGPFSPDGRLFLTRTPGGKSVAVFDSYTRRQLAELSGDEKRITHAEFNPDGKQVLTVSEDATVRVWSIEASSVVARLDGHGTPVTHAEFSPDGKRVVTVSGKRARIWRVEGEVSEAFVLEHDDILSEAVFDPTGRRLVTLTKGGEARLWDPLDGVAVADLSGHENPIVRVAFSPDGRQLLTGSKEDQARLWASDTGQLLTDLGGKIRGRFKDAIFSPNGRYVLAGEAHEDAVNVWDAETGRHIRQIGERGQERVLDFAVSPDGEKLVIGYGSGFTRVWSVATGELIAETVRSRPQDRIVLSPDGRFAVALSDTADALRFIDVDTGEVLAQRDHQYARGVFSPSGRRLLSWVSQVYLWNLDSLYPEGVFHPTASSSYPDYEDRLTAGDFDPSGNRVFVKSRRDVWLLNGLTADAIRRVPDDSQSELEILGFSPEGRYLFTKRRNGPVRLWDAGTGDHVRDLDRSEGRPRHLAMSHGGERIAVASGDRILRILDLHSNAQLEFVGHDGSIRYAEFSPDDDRILTVSSDGSARLWNAATGESLLILGSPEGSIREARFGLMGRRLITVNGSNHDLRLLDASDGRLIGQLNHPKANRRGFVGLSPDGSHVLTAEEGIGDGGHATLWSAESGELLAEFQVSRIVFAGKLSSRFLKAVFSPEGRTIVSAHVDDAVRAWDVESGKLLAKMPIGASVDHMELSPDGIRLIVVANQRRPTKKVVQLWDIRTGELLAYLPSGARSHKSARFSPDGSRVLIVGHDGARIWRIPPYEQALIDYAHDVKLRNLTPEERRNFVLGQE